MLSLAAQCGEDLPINFPGEVVNLHARAFVLTVTIAHEHTINILFSIDELEQLDIDVTSPGFAIGPVLITLSSTFWLFCSVSKLPPFLT